MQMNITFACDNNKNSDDLKFCALCNIDDFALIMSIIIGCFTIAATSQTQ